MLGHFHIVGILLSMEWSSPDFSDCILLVKTLYIIDIYQNFGSCSNMNEYDVEKMAMCSWKKKGNIWISQ